MSEKDVEKAVYESVANVEVENMYHGPEEIKAIKDSILNKESSKSFLKKLIERHSEKRKEEYHDRQRR